MATTPTGALTRRPWNDLDWARWLVGYDFDWGLEAARELRRSLEQHEGRHVAAARHAGASWEWISWQLGVARQSAHAKWAHRLAALDG